MKVKNLKKRIREKNVTIGTWLTIGHTSIVEIIAESSFDWITIDIEHNLINPENLKNLILAGQSRGLAVLVRVPSINEVDIKYALDAGADGIIAPMVNNLNDAKRLISFSYYPPIGKRGVGLSRAQRFGKNFNGYLKWASEELILIAQIESKEAIDNLEELCQISEIDSFMIGPYDLSASLGMPGSFDEPLVKKYLENFKLTCKKYRKATGIHIVPVEPKRAKEALDEGYSFIAFGADFNFLLKGCENVSKI